jgi:GT2 family glycosyltransferase
MTLPVTVVVCTRNRPALMREAIASIVGADATPAEVIVVDQSDEVAEELEPASVDGRTVIRHLRLGERGLSRARNAGLEAAGYELIAFIDDDVLVTPQWLSSLVRPLDAGERVATTGPVLIGDAETEGALEPSSAVSSQPAEFAGRLSRDVLAGGNMAVPRRAVADVGGFDERLGAGATYPAADDNDFGYRLLEAGYRVAYVPDAAVYHRAWRPETEYVRLRWRYGLGQGGFYAKHLSLRDRHMLRRFGMHAAARVAMLPIRSFHDRRRLAGDSAFLAGLVVGAGRWLLRERA